MTKSRKNATSAAERLVCAIRRALREHGHPKNAAAMQAHLRSEMPFHGVAMRELCDLCRRSLARHCLRSGDEWSDAIGRLWREATHREERYAAIELAAARQHEAFRTLEAMALYEEMIVTGAWWDYVDPIAANLIGELLRRYPREVGDMMRDWAMSDNHWKRRAAILCQLKFRHHTDTALLYHNIEQSLDVPNFFLRQAIGRALREYARTDPSAVRRFVAARARQLHPTSRNEAMKNIEAIGFSPRRAARGAPPA